MSTGEKIGWGIFILMMIAILLSCGTVFVPWLVDIFKSIWKLHWLFRVAIVTVGSVLVGLFLYALDYGFREAGKYPPP